MGRKILEPNTSMIFLLLDDSDDTYGDNCYVQGINIFAVWCRNNFLDLNVKKIKEMIIDYCVEKEIIESITINGGVVEVVTLLDQKLAECTVSHLKVGLQLLLIGQTEFSLLNLA